MKEKLLEIIADINPFIDVNDNTDLIEDEVLDSLGIMSLIEEIESAFHIEIDISVIKIDDFRNLDAIISLITKEK